MFANLHVSRKLRSLQVTTKNVTG